MNNFGKSLLFMQFFLFLVKIYERLFCVRFQSCYLLPSNLNTHAYSQGLLEGESCGGVIVT